MKTNPLLHRAITCLAILALGIPTNLRGDEPADEATAETAPAASEKTVSESDVKTPAKEPSPESAPAPVPPSKPKTAVKSLPKPHKKTTVKPLVEERSWLEATYETLIAKRLSVGGRITSYSLKETERPPDPKQELTFIGNLDRLHAVNESRIQPVVAYRLSPYLALEYTQDRVAARTQNRNIGDTEGSYDGTIQLSGPVFSAMLRVPIYDRVIPYVGIGYASWKAKYIYEPWWHLGWGSPEQYDRAGRPGTSTGKIRHMYVEDDSCYVFTLGLAIKLSRYAELDFMMRRMDMTSTADFYAKLGREMRPMREGEFPMKHSAYGAALSVIF